MYRKLMMLLMVVAVLGLAIGLVGCPQQETTPAGGGGTPPEPMEGGPGRAGPPSPTGTITPPEPEVEEVEVEVEEMEEEATGE